MSIVETLREQVRGQVIAPEDPEYDAARAVFNGMVDKRPAAILRVAQVADVITGVNLARDAGLPLAIRGGGHSAPGFGTCDDGLVLDFVNRTGVRVDPATSTARSEGGATWADFNYATHAFGLATTGGIIGTTGVAGLTLGGGIGYLSRKYGLSCDNLLSADVVLADGRFVTASATENDDLFWALRGGGGNFGVVTTLEFDVHPVDDIFGGAVIFSAEHTDAVARAYREFIADAPEEFGVFLGFHQGPPVAFLPAEFHGQPVVVLVGAWTGALDEGQRQWDPLLGFAPVAGSFLARMPYPTLNTMFDALNPKGMQGYWKADFLPAITDDVVNVMNEFGRTVPSVQTSNHFYPINGAVHRVGAADTAFAYRDVDFAPTIACQWTDPADNDANIAWARAYWSALHEFASPGGYINFMDGDDQGRIADNYRGNYTRLTQVKAVYDPGNLFHLNQNIAPA